MAPTLRLKPGREKSLLRRHPWIFSGAVAERRDNPTDGDTVQVVSAKGEFLAWGAYSSRSQIQARVWSWDPEEVIDAGFFRRRLEAAATARRGLIPQTVTDSMRLVHGESDGLPGLVVDQYGETLSVQFLSSGPERWRGTLVELLFELTGAVRIWERSDVDVRELEGLPPSSGLLAGEPLPEVGSRVQIRENDLRFWVDVGRGHKTGYYLDQRANRARLRELGAGQEVLDLFCYSGGFTVNALAGGAKSTLSVDASEEALALVRDHITLNDLPLERNETLQGDVFQLLRRFRDSARRFDLIVLDPPKFAQTAAQAQRAARGYKDINLLAFKLLRPGGLLFTFSCSGGVSEDLFQKIVAGAAVDAGVEAQIVERLHQDADHPVALHFPEGAYLKGFVIRV